MRRKKGPARTAPTRPRRTPPPRWVPLPPGRAEHISRCREKWENRALVEADDATAAAHVSSNYAWSGCPDGVPWSFVKAAWRVDEANPECRCALCGGPLAVRGFGHGLTRGVIWRDCLACRVSYTDQVGQRGVSDWIGSVPAEFQPDSHTLGMGSRRPGGPEEATPASGPALDWSKFLHLGQWDPHVPGSWGLYLTAEDGGSRLGTRRVELDEAAFPRRGDHRDFHGWWWTRPLPEGLVTLPFGPDRSWTASSGADPLRDDPAGDR